VIEKRLGAGAMGVVYLAVHQPSGRRVAIKILPKELTFKGSLAERFERETSLLEKFKHKNIVHCHGGRLSKTHGVYYYIMELLEGGTLDELIDHEAPFDWQRSCRYAIQICDALHFAHQENVVHRDLKPSNLLLTSEGNLKLSDFGIAKDLLGEDLTATGRTLGTASYMAPEQISASTTVSHKTDLYALGVIMHQMLTKSLPFEANSQTAMLAAHISIPAPRISKKNPEIPMILDDLVYSMLQKAPSERPWDALAVATQLRELLEKDAAGKALKYVVRPGQNPNRAGVNEKPRKLKKEQAATVSRRPTLEVAGLLTTLILLLGLIGYFLWPAGPEYLHSEAAKLMASEDYSDWLQAMNRFVEPLERRFPEHAYKEDVSKWRDQVALTAADRRAMVLDRSTIAALVKADGPAEDLYVKARDLAVLPTKENLYQELAGCWIRLAEALKPIESKDKNARGWILLADKRATDAKNKWTTETNSVLEKFRKWQQAKQFGSPMDEETTLADFNAALLASPNWRNIDPSKFPDMPEFKPVLPPPIN
jgi:serine/threonine-protein kinase